MDCIKDLLAVHLANVNAQPLLPKSFILVINKKIECQKFYLNQARVQTMT